MPELTLWRWAIYRPALGNNLDLERPFFFRVKAGLSKVAFADWSDRWRDAFAKQDAGGLAALMGEVAKLGDEPLTVNGEAVDSLEKYAALGIDQPGHDVLLDFFGAMLAHNSWQGSRAHFSERLSGGSFTTPATSPGTAAATSGRGTSV